MAFPATAALVADQLGSRDAAAYDLSAGCTGFMYALAQAHATVAAGLAERALVSAGTCSRGSSTGRTARRSCSSATAPARSCSSTSTRAASSASSSAPTARGGPQLLYPGSGSRIFDSADGRYLTMNGREVFKFATRVLVSSAEAVLAACELTVDDVDVYVPHQANVRIIDHAVDKLGFPEEKVVVNVDRYGNTSSGSIPLALADAVASGRLRPGKPRADDRDGGRPHVGLGADATGHIRRMERADEQAGVHVPRAGLVRARHGARDRRGDPRGDGGVRGRERGLRPRPASALLRRAPPRS